MFNQSECIPRGAQISPQLTLESDDGVHEMEAARMALEKACKEIGQIDEKSSRTRLGLIRKSARTTANKAMREAFVHDFAGLQAVVGNFESE
jgi:hypothetical protein